MKVLECAPYAFLEGKKNFLKNKSGLAYMVSDIASSIAEKEEVYLITQSSFSMEDSYKKMHICKKSVLDLLVNIRLSSVKNALQAVSGLEGQIKYKLKIMVYFLSQGYFEKCIDEVAPDIVHIHSISYYTLPFLMAAAKKKKPILLTLHGMISELDESSIDNKQKHLEKDICMIAEHTGLPITVISSGVKNRMDELFSLNENTLRVILNGTYIRNTKLTDEEKKKIYSKYNIHSGQIIFIVVGSICKRKNQLEVLYAYNMLPDDIKAKTKLLFIGNGPLSTTLDKEIIKLKLEDRVVNCGFIAKDKLEHIYEIAHFNVTASKDEGFGLPIIEGFCNGIPTITYKDLDAVNDLNDGYSMILAEQRSIESLSNAMYEAILKNWDVEKIKQHGKKFLMPMIADQYIEMLRCESKKNIVINEEEIKKII